MTTECIVINTVKKNRETRTSKSQRYLSVLRQFDNLEAEKADKAQDTDDT